MAEQRDRDDLDRDLPLGDDARGVGDEELDEDSFDEDDEETETEEDVEARGDLTGEIGSEGGSPGEDVRVRNPR